MPKGYWISAHRKKADASRHAAYVELAIPAIEKAGGRFLVKGGDSVSKENGLTQTLKRLMILLTTKGR